MQPHLFGAATFAVFVALAVAIGTAVHFRLARRAGLPLGRVAALYVGTGLLLFVGARAFSMLLEPGPASSHWIANGFRYPGALLALLVALPVLGRALGRGIPLRLWGDLMVPGAAFALAVLRINCLVAGCCAGRISQLPWALRFPAGSPPWYAQTLAGRIPFDAAASLPVHPLQVYFLLLALALGILALWWLARRAYDGQLVLLFLALHEGGKALLEPLRQPPVPQLEVVSAAVAVAASLTLLAVWARARVRAGLEAA